MEDLIVLVCFFGEMNNGRFSRVGVFFEEMNNGRFNRVWVEIV